MSGGAYRMYNNLGSSASLEVVELFTQVQWHDECRFISKNELFTTLYRRPDRKEFKYYEDWLFAIWKEQTRTLQLMLFILNTINEVREVA